MPNTILDIQEEETPIAMYARAIRNRSFIYAAYLAEQHDLDEDFIFEALSMALTRLTNNGRQDLATRMLDLLEPAFGTIPEPVTDDQIVHEPSRSITEAVLNKIQ